MRFTVKPFEPLRWHVYDEKYDAEYLVDFSPEVIQEHRHGFCGCNEFRFQVHINKVRTTCVHINFLIDFLLNHSNDGEAVE